MLTICIFYNNLSNVFKITKQDSIEGDLEENKPIERTMIWSEQEACAKQVTQISTSACGTTACINVLVSMFCTKSINKYFSKSLCSLLLQLIYKKQ